MQRASVSSLYGVCSAKGCECHSFTIRCEHWMIYYIIPQLPNFKNGYVCGTVITILMCTYISLRVSWLSQSERLSLSPAYRRGTRFHPCCCNNIDVFQLAFVQQSLSYVRFTFYFLFWYFRYTVLHVTGTNQWERVQLEVGYLVTWVLTVRDGCPTISVLWR